MDCDGFRPGQSDPAHGGDAPEDSDGIPDTDGDGHVDHESGGDDCDDGDADRYPGNVELVDPDDVDNDCDPFTTHWGDSGAEQCRRAYNPYWEDPRLADAWVGCLPQYDPRFPDG